MPHFEARFAVDGSCWIRVDGSVFQLSEQQATILRTIYNGDRCGRDHHCFYEDFHVALWKHEPLTRGTPRRWCANKQAGTPLSASRRAALSRSLRRLTEQGLIGKHLGLTKLTDLGLAIAKKLLDLKHPGAVGGGFATLTGQRVPQPC